jgi:toxin ParE1/3/4
MNYQLTEQADNDLLRIYLEGFERFGKRQTDLYHRELHKIFGLLGTFPFMAPERPEIQSHVQLWMHSYKSHLIVYTITEENSVLIVRVRHTREQWWQQDDHSSLDD